MTDRDSVLGTEALRLRTNGVTLHAMAGGPEDGPLVILLHGFPEFWYGWRHQIPALAAAGLRVLVPDQRGYNLSDKPKGRAAYHLDLLADDVLGLADALGRGRFAVVGHDWGGIVAWHLAARAGGRVERAAILNAPHPATVRSYMLAHPSQAARSWYVGFFQAPVVPEQLLSASDYAWLRRALDATARPGTFTPADAERYRAAWAQPGALTAMINWYRALPLSMGPLSTGAIRSERISSPVRVIWGDRDAYLESPLAEAGAALCERGEVFQLSEATQCVQHDEATRGNELLVAFLTGERHGNS